MPSIPNFPPELMTEHRNWHHARHQIDTNNPPPGYGQDFLQFHRQYIAKARQWYLQQGYDPGLIQPWLLPPEAIRQSPCYDLGAEQRITMNPGSFASADELGRFIEASGLHNCIHQQSARYYNEPALNNFDIAPGSTVFYQIHGMIDRWYAQWEAAAGMGGAPRSGQTTRRRGRMAAGGARMLPRGQGTKPHKITRGSAAARQSPGRRPATPYVLGLQRPSKAPRAPGSVRSVRRSPRASK